MIESRNSEIDVQELMERVRREAANARPTEAATPRSSTNGRSATSAGALPAVLPLPPVSELPLPPPFGSSGPVELKKQRLEAVLQQARETTEVSHSIPKFLRGLFRKQGGYNRALLDAVAALVKTNAQLNKRVEELQAAGQQHSDWIRILVDHRQGDVAWMKQAAPLIAAVPALQKRAADDVAEMRRNSAELRDNFAAVRPRIEQHTGDLRELHREAAVAAENLRDIERQIERLQSLQEITGRQSDRLDALHQTTERQGERLQSLHESYTRQSDRVEALHHTTQKQAEHLQNIQTQVDTSGEHLRNLQRTADQLLEIHAQNERTAEHLRNLQTQADRQGEFLEGLRGQTDRHADHLRNLQDHANTSGEHLRHLQDEAERAGEQLRDLAPVRVTSARLETEIAQLGDFRRVLARLEERQANEAVYLKGQISHHAALLQQWLTSAPGKKRSKNEVPAILPKSGSATELDAFYLSFEDRFRGARSEIKDRVRFYLPILKKAKAGSAARPILDVGCGRGEWLELLEENGLRATGVDLNTAMVEQCTARNFDVTQADAIAHLGSLPANSLGCVSGFHIIEHLPFETLLELFMQTRRVLKPGGIAIFETPNCKNLFVGACYFNVDPTHRNPVFPETAAFILETQGFEEVRLEYLSPATPRFIGGDADALLLNDLLFGAQDFAVIGRKPAAR